MAVYLHLFHGRNHPDDDLDDWGFDGPSLGPFDAIQTTYFTHIRPIIDHDSPGDFRFEEDCFVWRGKFYGDWYVTGAPEIFRTLEPIEDTIAELRRTETLSAGRMYTRPGALWCFTGCTGDTHVPGCSNGPRALANAPVASAELRELLKEAEEWIAGLTQHYNGSSLQERIRAALNRGTR